ncbi:MAG: ROK family protein [Clostridiaceae bacterium]|jgi:glucokinase|nr:ROK family protein [Clostridiaceae bacterium]
MYYIGIDIGGMSIKTGLVDETGRLHFKKVFTTKPDEPSLIIISCIADFVKEMLAENALTLKDISGIGIGIPGSVDSKKGTVRYCCNINLVDVKLVAELSKLLNFKNIKISNDANCAALGETRFGAGRGAANTVMITLGTGVGSGIISDGRLFEGGFSAGAEAGHTTVMMKGGDECGCGFKGHWEAYASATALIRQTKRAVEKAPTSKLAELAEKGVTGRTAFDAAKQGCKAAQKVVRKYLEYVGIGLVNLCNLFYPEIVIIGGGISNEGDYIIKPLQRYANKYVYGRGYNPKIKITRAELLNDAGIIGAASLCMEQS